MNLHVWTFVGVHNIMITFTVYRCDLFGIALLLHKHVEGRFNLIFESEKSSGDISSNLLGKFS